jgi:hypothetical protein
MITEYDADAVRWRQDRPVAVGDLELAQPTRVVGTGLGFWGLYAAGDDVVVVHPDGALRGRAGDVARRLRELAGDQDRAGDDRQAAGSFLPFLGGDDPGAAEGVPRSQADSGGPPPTYWLSDRRNAPPDSE